MRVQEKEGCEKKSHGKRNSGRKAGGSFISMDSRVFQPKKLEETIALSRRIVMNMEKEKEVGLCEFIFGQMRFISKETWAVKAVVFAGMLAALYGTCQKGESGAEQIMAVAASLLVLTAIPEIWKNIRYQAMDVESCTRFGLKKAYMARFLLLGMADLCMATAVVLWGNKWLALSFYQMALWLLVPYNSMLMVCLSVMAFGKKSSEYMAESGGALWMAAVFWLTGYLHIYEKVQLFLWGILLLFSYVYLAFVIGKIIKNANGLSEVEYVRN